MLSDDSKRSEQPSRVSGVVSFALKNRLKSTPVKPTALSKNSGVGMGGRDRARGISFVAVSINEGDVAEGIEADDRDEAVELREIQGAWPG